MFQIHEGTRNDERLTIVYLDSGFDLLYGGAGWTYMVSTQMPKSVQDSK